MSDPTLTTTAITWDRLSDVEKAALHILSLCPRGSCAGTILEGTVAESLFSDSAGGMNRATAAAVDRLATEWHRAEGRL